MPKAGKLGAGVIDSDYRGEIRVLLFHAKTFEGRPFQWAAGDRIAQLLLLPVARMELVRVSSLEEMEATARGAAGFGSTGGLSADEAEGQ